MVFVSSFLAALTVGLIVKSVVPNVGRLSQKMSPYDAVVRVRIDDSYSPGSNIGPKRENSVIIEIFRPMVEAVLSLLSTTAFFDDDQKLALKLQQAGIDTSIEKYKLQLVKKSLIGIAVGFLLGAGLANPTAMIIFPLLFGITTLSKSKSSLDKKIDSRKRLIRLEMYTIDQLLALHIRTGAGVNQALQAISQRTHGIVSGDCATILSRARSGMPIDESLRIAARETPEPHAQRTYKLLAATSQRGADLTQGLLDLAHDLRRSLREDIKATSAKRRAAMLIPTIGILAPIMLLFVAAPIPSIVLGGQ